MGFGVLNVAIIGFSLSSLCGAWNQDDLAFYDLIEEVNQNFYDFFDISQEASTSDVKKAYRRLSLEWHPDRNSAENAAEKFRQVVGVYEVLKDNGMRETYNGVLENGMPDWKSGIYYYRRYRKMGSVEALLILFLVFSGGHYLMLWGAYFEKYLVEIQKKTKSKKGEKKSAKSLEEEENERRTLALQEYRPTWKNTLPILLMTSVPSIISFLSAAAHEKLKPSPVEDQEELLEEERQRRSRPAVIVPREERIAEVAQATAVTAEMPEELVQKNIQKQKEAKQEGVWSGEDMSVLIKLSTQKFPPGSSLRWQQIARTMGRTVEDVTAAARRIRHHTSEELAARQSIQVEKMEDRPGEWSKEEQKMLEAALVQFPKGTAERWDRIAEAIPGRTKGEVVERFKKLAELIKAKKEKS